MTTADLGLKNVRLITPTGLQEVHIIIEAGSISKITSSSKLIQAKYLIDGKNSILLPQTIDTHVHFREPGYTEKEDFETGSRAAAAGGITTVIEMPNTRPPTRTPELLHEKIQIGRKKSLVNFALHAGLPTRNEVIPKLIDAGATSIKIYTTELEDPSQLLKDLYDYILSNRIQVKFSIHAEDPKLLDAVHDATITPQDISFFAHSRPSSAEEMMVKKIIAILEKKPVPTHICHVSTRKSLEYIIQAKKKGLPITCEITPHHYFLNMDEDKDHGPYLKCNPPVRSAQDMSFLQDALSTKYVDIVASDHAPHTKEEKERGLKNINDAPSGIVGLETLIPTLFTLNHRNLLTLNQIKHLIHEGPTKTYNFKNYDIAEGSPANITIVDPNLEWKVKGSELHGKTKFTPFEGKLLKGKVTHTIINGILVYEEGEIIAKPGHAKFITPTIYG